MSETRTATKFRQKYDQDEAPPTTIRATFGMRRRLSLLCEVGIYGTTVEEVCERLVCRKLQEMESGQ